MPSASTDPESVKEATPPHWAATSSNETFRSAETQVHCIPVHAHESTSTPVQLVALACAGLALRARC